MSEELNNQSSQRVSRGRCSFCHLEGHNITRCNNGRILRFEREIINYIQIILIPRQDPGNMANFRQHICDLAQEMPELIRAFAIRKCGANTRNNIRDYIESIIQYFTPIIRRCEEEEFQRTETHFEVPEFRYFPPATHTLSNFGNYLYTTMFIQMIDMINRDSGVKSASKFHIQTTISNVIDSVSNCECNICYEEYEKKNFIKLNCGHEFCKDCIKQSLQNEKRPMPCCAFCREVIKNLELSSKSIEEEFRHFIKND
jgi:hypothetical protein